MSARTARGPATTAPSLEVRAAVAARGLDVDVTVPPGEVVAVLGENGAGKSTLLHVVCGLVRPDAGRVSVDGRVVVDTADGVWAPPHRRRAVLLAQDPALFPHLTVEENVAFGPRSQGAPRRDARAIAAEWLDAMGVTDLADRRPGALSGGQAQRVAIARALATDPAVLLLDEPLSAVDVALAPTLRLTLGRVIRDSGRTVLLVTHDILDALALADRVIVLDGGRVVEDGPARDVLDRPRSAFAARLAGVNLLHGRATPDGLTTPTGLVIHGLLDPTCAVGRPAVALFPPNAVAIHTTESAGSPRNRLPVTITHLEPRGAIVRVHGRIHTEPSVDLLADVTAAATADLGLAPGRDVRFVVKATEIAIHSEAPAASPTAPAVPGSP